MNILAVTPGIGGQPFDTSALHKVRALKKRYGGDIRIAVDGGVNTITAQDCAMAGADVLIAGTSLFGRSRVFSDSQGSRSFRENLAAMYKAIGA